MARRKSLNRQDTKLAQQRAKVRFGPEHSTIGALIGQAQGALASDLSSADAAAKSAIHFAKKSEKPVRQVFAAARTQADAARSDVESAFGKLGGAADPFRAATAREQAGAAQRTALAGANALQELTQRKLEAKAGGQYARTAAKQEYRKTVGDLAARLSDLGDREGAFIAAEAGGLKQARAGRKATSRVKRMDIRADTRAADTAHQRELEKIRLKESLAGGGGGGSRASLGGNKPASRSELRMFKSDFAKALNQAQQASAHGVDRSEAQAKLTTGTTGANAIPSIDDQLALAVGLDMAYSGRVSRGHARELKRAGLRVKDLPGATSLTQWKRKRNKSARAQERAYSQGSY
jgi:hypothetical protein